MANVPGDQAMARLSSLNECWRTIGTIGDGSCSDLEQYVLCRNCPVYERVAAQSLNREASADYIRECTEHFSRPNGDGPKTLKSAFIFRIEREWLALPTAICQEVTQAAPFHTLPHQGNGVIMGLVNVRGELVICVSLARALNIPESREAKGPAKHSGFNQILVVARQGPRLAFPLSEMYGIHRYDPEELRAIPTLTTDKVSWCDGVLPWRNRTVGCINDSQLFDAVQKSFL
ncbi:MAG TPA: chemotaxis protein CheW [Blastocatellia bacterium]|nr:chemotaxis protein CheW [Blastocatellia bacterium]